MANWCYTSHCIQGSPEILSVLMDKLEKQMETDSSVYSLLVSLGIDPSGIYCRSFIDNVTLEPGKLFVDLESAWGPDFEAWDAILNWKYFKNKMTYVTYAEECGCEVYVNTDTTREIFPTTWKLDDGEMDPEYYGLNEADILVEDVNKLLTRASIMPVNNVEDISDALSEYNRKCDKNVYLYEFLPF